MDSKSPFSQMYTRNYDLPVISQVKNLNKYISKNINQTSIRSIDLDYEKKKNLYQYMKNLAFMKYQYINYIKILRKKISNTYNEVKKLIAKRSKSHYNPIHDKIYHILIYQNLYNYKYKPYTFSLKKSDYVSYIYLTDENIAKKRKTIIKKKNYINPYYQREINDLKKKYERIVDRKNLKIKNFSPIKKNSNTKTSQIKGSNNSCTFLDKKKLTNKKSGNKSENNIKSASLILPKIEKEYLSAQEISIKIEKEIQIMSNEYNIFQNLENKSKNKSKNENKNKIAKQKIVKFSPLIILHGILGKPPNKIQK